MNGALNPDHAKFVVSTFRQGFKMIENYLLESELGRGNFGTVYRARDLTTGNLYALKAINRSAVRSEQQKKMLMTEVSIMNKIDHPNVLHLHKLLKSKNNYYLVMDYCNQGDLFHYIRSKPGGCLPESDAIDVFKQIMNGFIEIRRHRVIHRDIKTENIFLRDDRAVIGDFGLSKLGTDTAVSFVGSRELMAPELLRSANAPGVYDSKIDLWSLGILFYEMLFGVTPFTWQNDSQILFDIHNRSGNNLNFPREVSANAKNLLRSLIRENPAERLDWNRFFNHPIFAPSSVASVGRSLFGKTTLGDYWNFDSEFQQNRLQNLDQLPKPELAPSDIKVITRVKVTESNSNPSSHLSQLIGYYLKEISSKYNHERQKTLWVGYAGNRLSKILADGEVPEYKLFLAEVSLLLLKKTTALTQKFLGFVNSSINMWEFDPQIFQAYTKSHYKDEIANYLASDAASLELALRRANTIAFEKAGNGLKYGTFASQPNNISVFDQLIKSELNNFMTLNYPVVSLLEPRKRMAILSALALTKLSAEIDRFFPFAGFNAIEKFDWMKFYDEFERKSEAELSSIIQA